MLSAEVRLLDDDRGLIVTEAPKPLKFRFVFVSGELVDQTEKSVFMFASDHMNLRTISHLG